MVSNQLLWGTSLLYGTGRAEAQVLSCLDAGTHNVDIRVH